MLRLLFEKKGNGIWISHLDLMRLFQRSFQRAGLPLEHSQGFNPRPMVSIALPMSVGVESSCELLDFDLTGEIPSKAEIAQRLNDALVPGVRVLEVYEQGRKVRDLAWLHAQVDLEYDKGVPREAQEQIRQLFARQCLPVEKKGKNGPSDQDIIPLLHTLELRRSDDNTICLDAVVSAQNPALNPMQLAKAVEKYLPDLAFDFAKSRRLEVYDKDMQIFR